MKCLWRFLIGKEPQQASPEEVKSDTLATPPGNEEASAIFNAGWRQCSIFKPCSLIHHEKECYFVVCTQSCSVVSSDWERDPRVEIIVGQPIEKYNERSQQARGKMIAKFHLPVEGGTYDVQFISLDRIRKEYA